MTMAGKLINVRITEDLFNELNGIVKDEGYKNIQELTKEMYRQKVNERRLRLVAEFEEWRKDYVKKRGNKKRASKEELSEYIGKKYGLI